jgi:hypothetical protein
MTLAEEMAHGQRQKKRSQKSAQNFDSFTAINGSDFDDA